MRIGIDARIAAYNGSGIARYLYGLLSGFERLGENAEFVICHSWRDRRPPGSSSHWLRQRCFTPPHFKFEKIFLPLELARAKLTLLHAVDFFSYPPSNVAHVLTVHDLYFLRDPQVMDRASFRHYAQVVSAAKHAAAVICDSESTKRDLLEFSDVDPGRVTVIYPGFERTAQATKAAAPAKPYLLAVGTIEPRKNIERIARAYQRVRSRNSAFPELKIVVRQRAPAE